MYFSRGSVRQFDFQPGEERAVFLREVAAILDVDPGEVETSAPLIDTYGVDEMEVFEFVQIAEDIWHVKLNPNPMSGSDFGAMERRFPTVDSIMTAAEAASGKQAW